MHPLLALLVLLGSAIVDPPKMEECKVPGFAGPARCGSFTVWENRETKAGRQIALHFVVLPAGAPTREAVSFFSGGPGQSAIDALGYVAAQLAPVRDTRDLLFLDLRGTGRSNPLPCKSAKPNDLQSYLKGFYDPKDVAQCAADLGEKAGVRLYNSAPALDDLEDLREALGYEQLDLYGISYGTRSALEYLRRHPQHVRAILMHGSSPNDSRYPLTVPHDAQLAIDGVFADCASDARCHAAFPDLRGDLAKSLRRLGKGPVRASVLDGPHGRMSTVMLSKDRYTEGLRSLLYSPSSAALVPVIVHLAAQGDFGPAAEEELAWKMAVEGASRGVHLSVTCAEDIDFIDPATIDKAAEGSFMSGWRAVDQIAACKVWPHAKLPASVLDPIRSEVPLLIMNGEDDPATAAYHAERLVKGFPGGRVVIIPHAGHETGGLLEVRECYEKIIQQFLRTADSASLDASCMAKVHRPPFPLEFPGGKVISLPASALKKFEGKYKGEVELEISVKGGKLHLLSPGDDTLLLPTSPRSFRMTVSPHTRITFQDSVFLYEDGAAPPETFQRVK